MHFTTTQTKIKEFFDKYSEETDKITSGLNDKMPSPYSSAQGTYVESIFDKILLTGDDNQSASLIGAAQH